MNSGRGQLWWWEQTGLRRDVTRPTRDQWLAERFGGDGEDLWLRRRAIAAVKGSDVASYWNSLKTWKETTIAQELSTKAQETLLELSERAAGDQPLMIEWDIQTELEKCDLISAAPHGGCLITEKGRAYVREMHN